MKNSFLLLAISFVLFSCNKAKETHKKMVGEWTIIDYTFQNNNNLSYKYESSGTINFENCSDDFCNFSLNMTYVVSGNTYPKNITGLYHLENDAEHYTIKRSNADGTISTLDKCRILLVNKDQMKTLIQDELGIHHFVLEK